MENTDLFLKFLIEERKNFIKSEELREEIKNAKNDFERKLLLSIEYGNMEVIANIKRDIITSIQNHCECNEHWLSYRFDDPTDHTIIHFLEMEKLYYNVDKVFEDNKIDRSNILEVSFYGSGNEETYLCNINYINQILNELGLSSIHRYDVNEVINHHYDNYLDSIRNCAVIDIPETIKVLKKS